MFRDMFIKARTTISELGLIGPMGEYFIDIRFVFLVGGCTASMVTGPFKLDV
jgi:hypothetical protein